MPRILPLRSLPDCFPTTRARSVAAAPSMSLISSAGAPLGEPSAVIEDSTDPTALLPQDRSVSSKVPRRPHPATHARAAEGVRATGSRCTGSGSAAVISTFSDTWILSQMVFAEKQQTHHLTANRNITYYTGHAAPEMSNQGILGPDSVQPACHHGRGGPHRRWLPER